MVIHTRIITTSSHWGWEQLSSFNDTTFHIYERFYTVAPVVGTYYVFLKTRFRFGRDTFARIHIHRSAITTCS